MQKSLLLSLGVAACCAIPSAQAALLVTNGDFETYNANQAEQENVTGWYDYNDGTSYHHPWQDTRDAEVPTDVQSGYAGEGALAFSGFASDNTQNGTTGNSWIYQSIGSDAFATAFDVTFDYGDFGNASGRDFGIYVAVYEYDGLGGFTAADNTDIHGKSGVTLLDSFTINKGNSTGFNLFFGEGGTLDISAQNGGELFLRINNFNPTGSEGTDVHTDWIMLDNVAITNVVPEPGTFAMLLGGMGMLTLIRRRRA